jgi:8-oxo-dGTP diphosphatase
MDEKYFYKIIVAAVIFNSEGKILLAKRSMDEDFFPGFWGLPGGKVEIRGNIDNVLEVELKREVLEEVGIKIKNLRYLESHLNESKKVNISFVAELDKGTPKPLEDTEKVEWLDLEEAKKLQLTPHTLERLILAKRN